MGALARKYGAVYLEEPLGAQSNAEEVVVLEKLLPAEPVEE